MKAILVTGASSGIGYGIVREFVKHDYHVFGSVRKQEDSDRLKTEIGSNFTPLLFDVTDSKAVQDAAHKVSALVSHEGLVGLINNAGIATSGPLIHQSLDEIRWQFEVNVISQIGVIQAFVPLLKVRKSPNSHPGRIINISSVAGKIASPFIGAYVGSKHAFEGISHSLRRELHLYGIDVIIIRPGAVNTPIWDKESAQDMSRYSQTEYAKSLQAFQKYMLGIGKQGYSPDVVGQFIRKVFETQKPKTEYAIVPQPLKNWIIPRFLPPRWLDKIISNSFNL